MKTKNLFKRGLAFVMSAVVMATTLPTNVVSVYADENGYDTTAPVITSVSVDKTEYNAGDTVTISVDITEEQTGISSCNVALRPTSEESTTDDNVYASFTMNGGSSLSGTYTTQVVIPDNAMSGDWTVFWGTVTDVQGNKSNLYEPSNVFHVVSDYTAVVPSIKAINVKTSEIVTPGTLMVDVTLTGDTSKVTKVSVGVGPNDNNHGTQFSGSAVFNSENGNTITIPIYVNEIKDYAGEFIINYATVNIGNKSYGFSIDELDESSILTCNILSDKEVTPPTIDTIMVSTDVITAPGVGYITLTGVESSTSIHGSLVVKDDTTGKSLNVNIPETETIDGKYTVKIPVSFSKFCEAGKWRVNSIFIKDEFDNTSYDCINTDTNDWNVISGTDTFTIVNDLKIEVHTSNTNPDIVSLIEGMSDNGTALLIADSTIVSADVFRAIAGTNKTVVLDMDGVQWFFNGQDVNIDNLKDVDVRTDIETINGSEYGYDEDVVALEFMPNGELPVVANVRLKSDYVCQKYDLNSQMYLAFIKDTVDDIQEEEVINDFDTTEDLVTMSEVDPEVVEDITDINEDTTSLVRIENAGITFDSEQYVTISMTHNSTYILSDKLPEKRVVSPIVLSGITATLTKSTYTLGEKLGTIQVVANYSDGTSKTVSSFNVTGYNSNKIGKQNITVSFDGKKASINVTVKRPNVTKVKISTKTSVKTLAYGKSIKLTATVSPSKASSSVTWKSSNTKYATVNASGKVKAKKAGRNKTVMITATAKDGSGKKASYKIKVTAPVTKIKLSTVKNLKVGKSVKVKATVSGSKYVNKNVTWKSSNTKYATVNASGKVKAKKAGRNKTVMITATATDGSGKKASIKIKVK